MGLFRNQWWGDQATRTVRETVAAFNARDFISLRELVTDDIRLIDSIGDSADGIQSVFLLLERLFAYDPAFTLHLEELTAYNDAVLVSGSISGSHHLSSERTLWRLVLRGGRVSEWRSYSADNPLPFVKLLLTERDNPMRSGKIAAS